MKTIGASEFKARCLALLDDVARTGEPLIILKRGKPVAEVRPPPRAKEDHPQYRLMGTVTVLGDIVSPVVPADDWDAERGEWEPRRPAGPRDETT